MDPRRFDRLVRTAATRSSRREALHRLGGLAAAVWGTALTGPRSARAGHCKYIGCGCSTGVLHACGGGLVCCPSSAGTPGGAGVCAPADQCDDETCTYDGDACPAYCNWGDGCPGCCSGYCGQYGQCGSQSCTSVGCSCPTGTFSPCDYGLVCCPIYPGLPGGAGVCQYGCG